MANPGCQSARKMKQLAIICALLVVPWIVANALGADASGLADWFGSCLRFHWVGCTL